MKSFIASSFALLIFCLLPVYARPNQTKNHHKIGPRIKKLVIDAGHGGKDSGSSGSKGKEKDITLKIALLLGQYVKEQLPDVQVIYTRKTDVFLELGARADVANRNDADVFISIHCNSLPKRNEKISGTETFVMGLHTAEENLAVAKRENEVILLEDNYLQRYGGYDPNSPEAHIILSMYQNAFISQSILLAEKVENQFKQVTKRPSRGVKQAGFVVLRATAMPSILVETGFLSNTQDEAYLLSHRGQTQIASAIFRAFKSYKEVVESGQSRLTETPIPSRPQTNPQAHTPSETHTKNKPIYRVQLAASPNKVALNQGRWRGVQGVEILTEGKIYRYVYGTFEELNTAVAAQKKLRAEGFPDAFVVAYLGSQRISIEEAKRL